MFFFLFGEDNYSSNEKLKQIKEKFVRDVDTSGYNIVVLDEKITVEKLAKELSQSGFLVSKKLVVIKNLLQQVITKDLSEFILGYLEKSSDKDNDSNIVVFYENNMPGAEKGALSGEKLKIFKKLSALQYAQEFKVMTNEKIISWIMLKFKENSKRIDKKLASILLAKAGANLYILENDINKISNYNTKEVIEEKSIDELSSSLINDDIFLFSEKLGNKNKKEAISLLNQQFSSGANPIYILTMITRQFRILLQIKSAISENVSMSNLASYLSIHPFVVKKSLASANLYTLPELKNIYKNLLEADKQIKSSRLDAQTILEMFIINI